MICRDKIGNLHTSYEKMNDSYHLKAFFGVNVSCAMNEVLKFPGLFKLEDTKEYLDSVIVTPKKKSITYVEHTSYLSPKYLAEEEAIKPKLLSISNAGNGIFYFYFDQHFSIHDKKKYKVRISVIDKSTTKAIEAKEKFIELNKIFSNISKQEEITEDTTLIAKEAAVLAEKIQQKEKQIYQQILLKNVIDLKTLSDFIFELKKEVSYIDDRIGKRQKRYYDTTIKDRPENSSFNIFNYFEKEFSKEVSFNFKEERDNDLSADKFPNLPKVRFFNRNNINYLLKNKIKTRMVDSIPSFESSYSKKHSYDYEQTLKNKAASYNIDFVNKIDDPYVTETQNFVVESSNEAVYVLNGHNNNNVTAENFVLLQEVRQNLQPNATYLCKTNMVESENQYFILEI